MGADKDCTTLNPQGDLVVARPEAVYFYSVDGRGPCFVFEGAQMPIEHVLSVPAVSHGGLVGFFLEAKSKLTLLPDLHLKMCTLSACSCSTTHPARVCLHHLMLL